MSYYSNAQTNSIDIKAILDHNTSELKILQKTVFYNTTKKPLSSIFLHNWGNSFKSRNTPLTKRFVEDYNSDYYFSKQKDRGYCKINNLAVNYTSTSFLEVKNQQDIIKVLLNDSLQPQDSVVITTNYTLKIPDSRFTSYGKNGSGYHLRFWYLVPAVHKDGWQTMSNLNLDDLFMGFANYNIEITSSSAYFIQSNLRTINSSNTKKKKFYLTGKNQRDVIISLDKNNKYMKFSAENIDIFTNLLKEKLDTIEAVKIVKKELNFIKNYLGEYPNKNIFIDWTSVGKNSLHDIFGLPDWFKAFPTNFEWEMKLLKALTTKYIDDVIAQNKRKDYWFTDGLQTFLMMEYIEKHYPDMTILGRFSKYWPIKNYNIGRFKQNDKYPFVYQFSARKFYDQSLTTRADSLSNFNRKIIGKYKAGLGLRYIQDYIGDSILKQSFKDFYHQNKLKISSSTDFAKILQSKTDKDLSWFFGDYIKTNKKIDYKIKDINLIPSEDSIAITIKNTRNITSPISLYGVKDKEVKFKTWITGVDSVKTIKIKHGDFDRIALNYEHLYPEYNSLDNFKKIKTTFFKKPIQFKLVKDIEDPYYHQIFYQPDVKYNFYDGVILGIKFSNKAMLPHNFDFSITPQYSTKTNSITGGISLGYNDYFEDSKIYKIRYGISASNYHYDKGLNYNSFSPYVSIDFKRNSLREVGRKNLVSRLIYINKEIADTSQASERDKYKVLNFRYIFSKPDVIRNFEYALNAEFSENFTKLSTNIRYRKQIAKNNSLELRLFSGVFLNNKTKSDYFNFSLNRGSDYLFEQNLFGRSEGSGIFSQQYVTTDGGFKSNFETEYANQFILSGNTSIAVWKWIEIYNDVAMLKSKNQNPSFFYENGIRLRFIPNIFEFYFPIYTNKGHEFENYPTKIKFVITTKLDIIYNYIRRGLF